MKPFDKAKEIATAWRQIKNCEPCEIVNGKALYKPEFILFIIERLNAKQFFDLQSTLEVARKASENI